MYEADVNLPHSDVCYVNIRGTFGAVIRAFSAPIMTQIFACFKVIKNQKNQEVPCRLFPSGKDLFSLKYFVHQDEQATKVISLSKNKLLSLPL